MTTKEIKLSVATAKDLMSGNRDQFREIVRDLLQELLEAEMTETLSAGKSERSRFALATARAIMTAR
jgi:transposase-like protein